MLTAIDAPFHALVRGLPDILAPLIARHGEVRSLLLFTHADLARSHLAALPTEVATEWCAMLLDGDDWRAKEELFRAAAAVGAVRVDVDPDLALRSRQTLPLAQALAYAASHLRATACI